MTPAQWRECGHISPPPFGGTVLGWFVSDGGHTAGVMGADSGVDSTKSEEVVSSSADSSDVVKSQGDEWAGPPRGPPVLNQTDKTTRQLNPHIC